MATPFDKTSAIDQPTDAQLGLIRTLLAERDWQSTDNGSYLARVEIVAKALDGAHSPEHLNARLEYDYHPPLPKPGASKLIEWLKAQPVKPAPVEQTPPAPHRPNARPEVPAGRYAIDTQVHAVNGTAFYKVDRPTEGRWAGRVFVKQLIGPEEQRLSQKQSHGIIAKIAEAGAEAAAARYGHEIGECGLCGRRLTNDESRARGIGPICAAKAGW